MLAGGSLMDKNTNHLAQDGGVQRGCPCPNLEAFTACSSHDSSSGDAADAPTVCPAARPTTVPSSVPPTQNSKQGGSFIKEGSPVYQASIKLTMQPWMPQSPRWCYQA